MENHVTIVSAGIAITGVVSGKGPVAIGGRIDGRMAVEGEVSVAPQSRCELNIQADIVAIHGNVKGNITASSAVALGAGAVVEGTLNAKRIEIDPKARFKGQLIMPITLPRGVKAPPKRDSSGW